MFLAPNRSSPIVAGRSSVLVVANASIPGSPAQGLGSGDMPRSVRYARCLLGLQGVIWACGALLFAGWTAAAGIMALTGDAYVLRHGEGLFLPVAVVAGGLAAVKFVLAKSLAGRRERTKKAVIGVEIAMACLGLLMTADANPSGGLPADLVAFAGFGGGGLSLAAVLALLCRPAKGFFAEQGPASSPTSDTDCRASFWAAPCLGT